MESKVSWSDTLVSPWHAVRSWLASWWQVPHLGAQLLALLLAPSSWRRANRRRLARAIYLDTAPLLPGFTAVTGIVSVVLIRIVVVTAASYGLTRYALEMVVRVLVLELVPLAAALFTALRCTLASGERIAALRAGGRFDALRSRGDDPLRIEVLPRVAAGVFAVLTLAMLSGAVALLLAYLTLYGPTTAALAGYTRTVGQVFSPPVALIFALKTLGFALAVALFPAAAALADVPRGRQQPADQWQGVVRMLATLLLIEVASLLVNYR